MTLPLLAILPFAGALVAAMAGRLGRHRRNASLLAALAATLSALALLMREAPAVIAGSEVAWSHPWIGTLGLDLSLRLDGLGLLFALLILGIGALILIYARFYLDRDPTLPRLISLLMLFQGAMLGIVLSANLLLLLIFWEMTSLASFLLIGFWSHRPEARAGAGMALAITGGGGLALIAGTLILGHLAGSFEMTEIIAHAAQLRQSALFAPAMALILLGAFAKSAQFPFHFWLPGAMAAPTPISAYLHSATMVKAGIFLLLRLWPLFAPAPEWGAVITAIGVLTLVLGAITALFQSDLKALLAYSTVSQLGLITMLLGLGRAEAVVAALFHLINHAVFKATLFLSAGIIEHEFHSRDLRMLSGIRRALPLTCALGCIAALSMAGLPPFGGFISKELMLGEMAQAPQAWLAGGSAVVIGPTLIGAGLVGAALIGAAFSAAYSFRLIAALLKPPMAAPDAAGANSHRGSSVGADEAQRFGLIAAPVILATLVLGLGLAPLALAGGLIDAATQAVTGARSHSQLALWHGLSTPLWLSLAAVGGGLTIWGIWPALDRRWTRLRRPDGFACASGLLQGSGKLCARLSDGLHRGGFSGPLLGAILALVLAGAWAFSGAAHHAGSRSTLPIAPAPLIGWACLVIACSLVALRHHDRLFALILTSVIGLMIAAAFALFSAPDLALTQIAVEVVTTLLMLMTLSALPRRCPVEERPARRWRDAAVAALGGTGIGALAYAMLRRDPAFAPISEYHLAQSLPGAGGANAVNTIILDFRGYDTWGEITVLAVAALVILALSESLRARLRLLPRRWRRAAPGNGGSTAGRTRAGAGHAAPMMMVVASRLFLPLAVLVGLHIFLRGHNLPGGGFVAGLILAIAIVAQMLGMGLDWGSPRLRRAGRGLIGLGLLSAFLTGTAPLLGGKPFLTSGYDHFRLPVVGEIELTSAALFDLGVFLVVLGGVSLALSAIARLTRDSEGAR